MKISGILFDKDGTLLNFNEFWVPAAQCVMKRILSDYGIPNTSVHAEKALNSIGIVQNSVLPDSSFAWKSYRDIADDLKPALESMEAKSHVDAEGLANKLVRYFEEESFSGNDNIKGTADLPLILHQLRKRGIQLGIATTDTYRAAVACLKRLHILPFFTFFAADQMPEPMPVKPDGRIILRAAQKWNTEPDCILVVGDTRNDMRFAHNGGAAAVGVLSGVSSEEHLRPAADHIIDSVADLPALVQQLEQEGR